MGFTRDSGLKRNSEGVINVNKKREIQKSIRGFELDWDGGDKYLDLLLAI